MTNGPRVIATHGLGDSAATWTALAAALAAHDVAVESWDLAGHGDAPAPVGASYTVDAALGELREIVHAGDRPVVLMGHSLGGYLSLRYALGHPGEVAGLVLIATGPGYRSAEARDGWNRYVERYARERDIAPGVHEVCLQHDSAVIDGLPDIVVPVVLFTGERDERFHAGGDVIAAKVVDGRHQLIPDAGHHPHVDAPETMAGAIARFVGGR